MQRGFPENKWKRIAARSPDPLGVMWAAERIWEVLDASQRERLAQGSESALADLSWFLAASPGLVPFLLNHVQETIVELFLEGGIWETGSLEMASPIVKAFLDACGSPRGLEHLSREISRFRNIQLVRLFAQELLGVRACTDVWRDWSEAACFCIQGALSGVMALEGERLRGARLVVLGMGKLGGQELNFASDLDLMYLYEPDQGISMETATQVADRCARALTKVLEGPTEEGPLFRVDLGLRPGGKDGALIVTVDAAELYYQSFGSPWERWALLRAHPVAGDWDVGQEFMNRIDPFVFRSSLDYSSLEDIRQMKARIEQEARWRSSHGMDVKIGQGGIRELEFLAQTLQIVHAGRRPALRLRTTLECLQASGREGILGLEEANALCDAYRFLRQVEHRVQMVHLQHTHRLPSNERELRRIACLMGYGNGRGVNGFLDDLKEHTRRVRKAFSDLVAQPSPGRALDPRVEEVLGLLDDERESLMAIKRMGFKEPVAVRTSLRRIMSQGFPAARSPKARQTLHRIFPRMLSSVIGSSHPDQTLFRMERLLEAIGPRGGYYALLKERPMALERLMEVLSRSAMLSRWLSEHVEALDALVIGHYEEPRRSPGELMEEANRWLEGVEDTEARLGCLRLFRAQECLRIGVGDLWGVLHPWEVGQELTLVAEVFLELTLEEVIRASGLPGAAASLPLSVVALGSFGARELSYRSDLDLMFLYDDSAQWRQGTGEDPAEFLTKVVQRMLSWMSVPMKEGPGWTVDARLRPSGTRGPLMVSLAAFRDYYQSMGRPWERQMLLRSRVCLGDPEVGQKVMTSVDGILRSGMPQRALLHEMRTRMERERGQGWSHGAFHLKLGPGGIADIEFLVQYYQWMNWAEDPGLRAPTTYQALDRLVQRGDLNAEEGLTLKEAHAFLKGLENRLGLVLDYKATDQPLSSGEIAAMGSLEGTAWVPPRRKGEDLAGVLSRTMAQVRDIYLRHLCPRT